MADYNDTHRAFLQVFLARGTLTYETAKPILAAILTAADPSRETMPNDVTPQDFSDYITSLNTAVSPFDFEIRSTVPQNPYPLPDAGPSDRVYALVNTTSDPITQLATTHTPDEIAFLKRVLDHMFETANSRRTEVYAVSPTDALRLSKAPASSQSEGSANAGLTKSEAERCLESLVAEGWLEQSKKGFYRLSPRALMELRTWLVETYNGPQEEGSEEEEEEEETVERVKRCQGCREIVIVGQRCVDLECGVRMHDFCARNALRAAGGGRGGDKCPGCGKGWTGEVLVGEKAAVRGRASGASSMNGAPRRSSGAASATAEASEEEEE
ncbi:hypothetical protein CAC42_3278 [Sphaceloma murrayae]|uniref:Non-structural maintenance of chromosomes element 1 homolog n=1 Tax=Sphaceloma murrayae TaxID=2082308 RepID=A0A2K1QFG2_9PEZI|nr:hypothetical protein CAC42_3278 [Sphaceloma murrayae]